MYCEWMNSLMINIMIPIFPRNYGMHTAFNDKAHSACGYEVGLFNVTTEVGHPKNKLLNVRRNGTNVRHLGV